MVESLNIVKFGHMNTRSILPSIADFSYMVTEHKFDIMAVTETWLSPNISSNFVSIAGYNFYRRDREGRGGGVGVYVNNHFICENIILEPHDINNIEMMWVQIRYGNIVIALGIVYRPPKGNINIAVEALDGVLSHLVPLYDHILVLGDFNVNFFSITNKVSQCFNAYDLLQLLNEPTRITGHSATLLDPIFFNDLNKCVKVGTLNADTISDHRVAFCEISFKMKKQQSKVITYRDFKCFNMQSFNMDLFNVNWSNILYINNINEKVKFMTENILHLFNIHSPIKIIRVSKPRAPWLTYVLKLILKERDKALSRYKRLRTQESWDHYKDMRNFAKASIRREKMAYLQYLSGQSSSSFFSALKSLKIQHSQSVEIPHQLSDVNEVNDHFASVFQNSDSVCSDSIKLYTSQKLNPNIRFCLKTIDTDTVFKIIQQIKSNAKGIDGVTVQMIRLCYPAIGQYITHIINCCIESGFFPHQWREALVIPLPKTSNPVNFSDLRPISLLPAMSKILEKIVCQQIQEYINKNNILPVQQSGFRKGYSTTTALAHVTDNIIEAYDNGQATTLTLLDFSKAFDTINHNLLIAKCRYLGFDDVSLNFLNNYLEHRQQRVLIGNNSSKRKPIHSGVPQGSVLGPLLFLIYVSDLPNVVRNCTIHCFADDTQLFYSFNPTSSDSATVKINEDLERIKRYADKHNLRLNPSKSKLLLFCTSKKRDLLKSKMDIMIDGELIHFTPCAKNLGVVIDENLRFQDHVSNLIKSCYVGLRLLYANRGLLTFKMKKMLCVSLILSKLSYCSVIFYPCIDQITSNRLQRIQNTCCRLTCNLRKYDHLTPSFKLLKWLKINNVFKYNFLNFLSNVMKTSTPSYLNNKLIFRSNIHDRTVRNKNILTMPHHRTAMFQRAFTYNAVKLFNSLDEDLKSQFYRNSFRITLRKYLMSIQ